MQGKILAKLTHSGLVTPYGYIGHGQHWLRYWLGALWHQAITWTNVDLSKVFCGNHLEAMLQEELMKLICNMFKDYNFKITTTSPRGQWVKAAVIISLFYFPLQARCSPHKATYTYHPSQTSLYTWNSSQKLTSGKALGDPLHTALLGEWS